MDKLGYSILNIIKVKDNNSQFHRINTVLRTKNEQFTFELLQNMAVINYINYICLCGRITANLNQFTVLMLEQFLEIQQQ